jgi:pyridoxamine 5'-phosphate oxidase
VPPADDWQDAWLAGPLPEDPLPLLRGWLDDAIASKAEPNPNSMTLATTEPDGRPSARVVLCKDLDTEQGWITFYTNLRSRKSRALDHHPYAALVFNWDGVWRQVRIEGPVTRTPDAEADTYFASRPLDAQLAAWASEQSEPIDSREALLERVEAVAARYSGSPPRPDFWGGYRAWIERIEFWTSRPGRVHDRGLWSRELRADGDKFIGGAWRAVHLQP